MSLEYDKLVEGFRDKIRGNISSVKLSPEEMQAEIAAVQDGAVSSFEIEKSDVEYHALLEKEEAVMPIKRKRGRPVGSKNRPKS